MLKSRLSILLVFMIIVTTIFTLSLGNSSYSQNQTGSSILDSIDVKNANLTLGTPFYIEEFEFPKSQNLGDSDNRNTSASTVYSFKGNGTLDDLHITASGGGSEVLRGDGTNFLTGRALFTSAQNGTASYSFEAITSTTDEEIRTSLGAAFFDANATGDLESLKSIVGVYESYIDQSHGKGIFAMWHIKNLLPK